MALGAAHTDIGKLSRTEQRTHAYLFELDALTLVAEVFGIQLGSEACWSMYTTIILMLVYWVGIEDYVLASLAVPVDTNPTHSSKSAVSKWVLCYKSWKYCSFCALTLTNNPLWILGTTEVTETSRVRHVTYPSKKNFSGPNPVLFWIHDRISKPWLLRIGETIWKTWKIFELTPRNSQMRSTCFWLARA